MSRYLVHWENDAGRFGSMRILATGRKDARLRFAAHNAMVRESRNIVRVTPMKAALA